MATVQQLTAKVSLQGVQQYLTDANRMERGWSKFAGSMQQSTRGMSGTLSKFAASMNSAGGLLAGLGAAGGLVAFGAAAVKTAADWEQVRITLETLTGSAEEAARKLAYVKRLAEPSPATKMELSAAAVTLEAYKLNSERLLPIAAKLQAAFEFSRPEALMDAVRLMGMISSGRMPEVEMLGGFGMNKKMFEARGIKFDSQGVLLSSARDVMRAFEEIVNGRYGDIIDRMKNTTAAKMATVQDKWQDAMIKVGNSLQVILLPILERVSTALGKLAEANFFDRMAKDSLRAFAKMIDGLKQIGMVTMLVIGAFHALTGNAAGALAALAGAVAIDILTTKAKRMLAELLAPNLGLTWDQISKAGSRIGGQKDDLAGSGGYGEVSDSPLARIASNTGRTADNTQKQLDYTRHAFGGGELGAMGVTPVEFAGVQAGERRVTVRIENGRTLEQIFADMVAQTVMQMKRQGAV